MSQPVEEYPNTVMTRQPDTSHSGGSFGPVFAVLAVIVVISAVACVLGRLCSKRKNRAKEAAHHPDKGGKQNVQGLPKEWQKASFARDGDIELGFGKKVPSTKGPAKSGGGKAKPPHQPEFRFSDN
ncbi:hypothetical protein ACS0TY_010253 [Phlomoides rotata]